MATTWDLSPGVELIIDGKQWRVESCLPHLGRVTLIDDEGAQWKVTLRELIHRPNCRPSTRTRADLPAASRGRQPKTMEDLQPEQRRNVMHRMDHIREVETGFRSGDPLAALPHEPRPQYDPETTTLTQRRHAKAEELRGAAAEDPDGAKECALHQVSFRTLVRWDQSRRKCGPVGLADDRWLREASGHRISPEIREALFAVRPETLRRSKLTSKDHEFLIHQYVRETFGDDVKIPSYDTLKTVWREWFGSSGARQRYARSAAKAQQLTGNHDMKARQALNTAIFLPISPQKPFLRARASSPSFTTPGHRPYARATAMNRAAETLPWGDFFVKRFLAWAVAGISLVALFLISPIVKSADAVEASRPPCATDSFCIYASAGATAPLQSYSSGALPEQSYSTWNEKVNAVVNNTAYWACVYENFGYGGTIQAVQPGNWADLTKLGSDLDGKVSSHKLAKSKAGCFTGYERCPDGNLCIFSDVGGRGEMEKSPDNKASYETLDNRVVSVANYTNRHACFYTAWNYSGTLQVGNKTYSKYVVLRSDSTVIPDPFNKYLSSHMLVFDTDDCAPNLLPAN